MVAAGFDGTVDDLDGAVVEQHHKVVCDVCGWNGMHDVILRE
jgi:hypothetical protein